jgi:hypothetical protein
VGPLVFAGSQVCAVLEQAYHFVHDEVCMLRLA